MPVNFEKIKQLREAAGLTQGAAAEAAGRLGQKSFAGTHGKMRWYDVESGRYADPRLSTLEAIATVLGVTVQNLLTPPAAPARRRRAVKSHPSSLSRPSGDPGSKG